LKLLSCCLSPLAFSFPCIPFSHTFGIRDFNAIFFYSISSLFIILSETLCNSGFTLRYVTNHWSLFHQL
jgi:hypothetical protein